ncbi:MAG: FAD-dependent oxidoreductase [Betaproteobacteria bacterium]|nr:FAD-dependent oxidoreductase [Betaproteobacteria bacterium]
MTENSPAANVAVVGAGWAGLAAAVMLSERGIPVTAFEASRNLGGRARRVLLDGAELDNGQHILIGAYRETLALMRRVGADARELLLRLPLELRFAGGFHLRAPRLPYPLNLLIGLWFARGLDREQALAALRFMSRLKATGFRVEPDCSVAAFLEAHGQRGPLRTYLWEPLCVSALNTPPDRASAQVFANVVRDGLTGKRENSDLLLPRLDLGRTFPDPAAEFVKRHGGIIELGAAVHRIERDNNGFRLDDRPQRFGHVIIACAPQHALALIEGFPELEAVRTAIEALQYEPIYTCYLQYADSVRLSSPMVGFTGGLLQWAFDRGKTSGRPGLIAAVASASGAHEQLSQAEFTHGIHQELSGAMGDLPAPLWSRVIAEKRATFSCGIGLIRPPTRTNVAGLFLAGDYTASDYPGTLEAAVRSGASAARAVLENLP